MPKIRMLKRMLDGRNKYLEGGTYVVNDDLARRFLGDGAAEVIKVGRPKIEEDPDRVTRRSRFSS